MHKIISLLIFLFSACVFAQTNLESRINDFDRMSKMFHEICFDKSGNFLQNEKFQVNGKLIDCARDAKTLDARFKELEREVEREKKADEVRCEGTELDSNFKNISAINDALNGDKVCPAKTETTSQCVGQMACNAMASVIGVPLAAGNYATDKAFEFYRQRGINVVESPGLKSLRECGSRPDNSCISNLLRGVWDSLFTSIKGLWTIAKGAATLAGSAIKSGYNYVVDSIGSVFSDVEDATSEKMMAASQLPDSALDQFKRDPLAFVKDMASALYESIASSVKEHYGCNKWSGLAYASTCVEPMDNWECATCNQRLNVICGVTGFAAGEIVTAFFTGGTVAVGKTVGMTAVKGGAVLAARVGNMIKRIPPVAYVARVAPKGISAAGRAAHLAHLKALTAWEKVGNLRHITSLKAVAEKVQRGTIAVSSSAPVKVVTESAALAAKPFTAYVGLMSRAFGAGYNRVDDALARSVATVAPKAPQAAAAAKATEVVPELTANQQRVLRLRNSTHEQEDLVKIIMATDDMLTDPVKLEYVLDKISSAKKLGDAKHQQIVLEVIEDVKRWDPTSVQARIAQIRVDQFNRRTAESISRIKAKNPNFNLKEAERIARTEAYARRARALELKKACTANGVNEVSVKAGTLYGAANLSLTVGATAVTYALANWNKVKDEEWAKRLGYEVFMSYLISKWGSKIATNQASTVTGKIVSGYGMNLKTNLIESTVYSTFFSHDKEKALARIEEISKSESFDEDVAKLDDYIKNRSRIEEFADASGDAMRDVYHAMTGKRVSEIRQEELQNLNPDALKDPIVIERLMDTVADQMYSEEVGGDTYGNRFLDRLVFDTKWGIHAVPRSIFVGMITYQAVCMNIDNPAKALGAFGIIQGANKVGSSLIYYHNKSEEINQ